MQLSLIQQLAAIIHQGYPDGIQKFVEDGGFVEALPTESQEVYVIHPHLPEALQKALSEFGTRIQTKIVFSTLVNFQGCDPDDVQNSLAQLVREDLMGKATGCMFMISPVSFTLLFDKDLSPKDLEEIETAIISKVPGVVRGVLVTPNASKMFEVTTKPQQVVVLNDRPQRARPIGQDDLTNLKIALATQSVDDFIASL